MWIINLLGIYLLLGLLFAIPFLRKGISKIDEGAKDSPFTFKLIILPGVIALWPLLMWKWIDAQRNITSK